MQKIVEDLKKLISFKDTTDIGDTVIIAAKEPQMLVYAHVIDIDRDQSRKDEWYHVRMAMLSIPLQKITWTLRTEQMTGQEIFTMGGEERFIKAINFEDSSKPETVVNLVQKTKKKGANLKRIK